MTRELFDHHWKIWCSVWKRNDREESTWWFTLQDMTDEEFTERSWGALRECVFFPNPAEIWDMPLEQQKIRPQDVLPELTPEERELSAAACRKWSAYVRDICSKSNDVADDLKIAALREAIPIPSTDLPAKGG